MCDLSPAGSKFWKLAVGRLTATGIEHTIAKLEADPTTAITMT